MNDQHWFEEHTSEVRLHVQAATLQGLFVQAARALADLLVDQAKPVPPSDPLAVQVRASDREALLVDWLNELIFQSEVGKRVYTEFEIERLTDRELRAIIRGVPVEELRTQVKAATFHQLRIEETTDGFRASVIL